MCGYTPVGLTGVLVCFSVFLFVRRKFGNGYLGRGLAQSDEISQAGSSRCPPGHLPFWRTLTQGLAPRGQKVKNFGNAYLVDRLHDCAEIS